MSKYPKDWSVSSFGNVAKLIKGITYKSSDYSDESNGELFITIKCVSKDGGFSTRGIKYFKGEFKKSQELAVGDMLIANTDLTRAGDIVGCPLILPNTLRSNKKILMSMDLSKIDISRLDVDKKFVYFFLKTPYVRSFMKGLSAGSTVLHLKTSEVPELEIPLPSLREQKKIAEILTSVDRVIELTLMEIDKLKDLRFAYVEANLNPEKSKWPIVTLASVLDGGKNAMRGGPFGSNLLKEEWTNHGIPYLGIDNIHKEFFNANFKRYVTEKKFSELKVYSVFEDDVVITIMGTIGRSCVIPSGFKKLLSSKHLRTLTIDKNKYIPSLLCYQLNYSSWVWKQYREGQQGGIMDAINNDVLKELQICCPPLNEQRNINNLISQIKNKIDSKAEFLDKIQSLKKGLMNDLLIGKVRV